jgi:hypothetical protein
MYPPLTKRRRLRREAEYDGEGRVWVLASEGRAARSAPSRVLQCAVL